MGDWFRRITYGELVNAAADTFGEKECLTFGGDRWNFREVRDEIDRAARALMSLGVGPGDRVALWMPNRPEWIHVQYAALKIGAILVPVNTAVRHHDLAYTLAQSKSSVLVTTGVSGPVDYLDIALAVAGEHLLDGPDGTRWTSLPRLRHVVVVGDADGPAIDRWADVLDRADEAHPGALTEREEAVDPDSTALIMYTSGSTGAPKGVMHNHRTIRNAMDQASRVGVRRDDVTMMYLPLFHAFGWCDGALMSFATGARLVLMERFDAAEVLRLVEQEHCTLLHGFDTHFKMLMDHPDYARRDHSSVRTGKFPAGTPASQSTARRARELGAFYSGWSMTELGPASTIGWPSDDAETSATSSGYPMPGYEIKVIDPVSGETQPAGTPGEICCRTYAVMQGYYNMPDETARTIDGDGWLHSGDMGLLRESGYLEFKGRYKEMLKVGGENVDPLEVEAHLTTLVGVAGAAVVGVPDERLHEVGVAFVIRSPEAAISEDDVLAHCRTIASFKRPRHVLFVEEFPTTASGKIQKFRLGAAALEQVGGAGAERPRQDDSRPATAQP